MSKANKAELWIVRVTTTIFLIFVLAGIGSFAFGLSLVAHGLFALLRDGVYSTFSIGTFLGLPVPNNRLLSKLLGWDREWWLIFIVPALCLGFSTYVAETSDELVRHVRRTPEERAREKARRKAEAEKEASQAKELKEDAIKAAKERKAERLAKTKPMSGWRRLWIVLSVLFGVPSTVIAWDSNTAAADVFYDSSGNRESDNAAFWKRARQTPSLSSCDWSTAEAGSVYDNQAFVTCRENGRLIWSLFYGMLPALVMAIVGLTVRWVYRGFKRPR